MMLYNALSDHLKSRFGQKVFKVTINAGFTCPNRDGTKGYGGCVYCESSTLVPKDFNGDIDVKGQLLAGIERVRKRHKADKFIAYFQINTNTHAPIEYLEKIYAEAMHPDVVGIAVSTRPDCVDERVLDIFDEIRKEKHLWLELGLQSSNDMTLERINRGHTSAEFEDAVRRAKTRGIDVCAHVILGLPGESMADMLETIRFISSLKVWGVKFHQLQVLKGTALEDMYQKGEVKVLGLEEYSDLVIKCLELLPPEVVIHRLSGDVPKRYLIAPEWGSNKFIIAERIVRLMEERNAWQGKLAKT